MTGGVFSAGAGTAGDVRAGFGAAWGTGLNRETGMNRAPVSCFAPSFRDKLVWLGVTVSAGFTPGITA